MTLNYLEDTFLLVLIALVLTCLFALFMYLLIAACLEVWYLGWAPMKHRLMTLTQKTRSTAARIAHGLWEFVYQNEELS